MITKLKYLKKKATSKNKEKMFGSLAISFFKMRLDA